MISAKSGIGFAQNLWSLSRPVGRVETAINRTPQNPRRPKTHRDNTQWKFTGLNFSHRVFVDELQSERTGMKSAEESSTFVA